jgi:NitT/TauT family transport system substrate-binding protein
MMKTNWRRSRAVVLSGIVAVAGSLALLATAPAQAAEKVTYLLPAPAFLPAFGPWMVAKARGYYAKEGLDVDFEAAKGGADVAKQVGVGNAVIGGAIGDTPIIVRANGVPVKAVAVLGGGGLMQLVSRADGPIKSPADLKGKTVTVLAYQDTTYYALLGMLAKVGLSKNDVDIQAAGPTGVWKLFVAGKSAAMAGVPDWIVAAESEGVKLRIIPADEYFPSMAQAIVASDDAIRTKPQLIRKLVQATLHGLRDIMKNPKSAAHDYVKAVPQNAAHEAAMAKTFELYNKYVYPGQKVLGQMDPKRLAAVENFYVKQGVVEKATPIADLYTNEFVK